MRGLLNSGPESVPPTSSEPRATTPAPSSERGASSPGQGGESRGLGAFEPTNGEAPTPEEQEAYNRFVGNALLLMSNDEIMPAVLRTIDAADDAARGVGEAAASIFLRVEAAAEEQGFDTPGDVKFQGGAEIVENVAEMARAARLADLDDEELERALLTGLDIVRDQQAQSGTLDQEAAQADLRRLVEAEKSGRLEQVLPGISEAAQRGAQASQPGRVQAAPDAPGQAATSGPARKPRRRGRRGGKRAKQARQAREGNVEGNS